MTPLRKEFVRRSLLTAALAALAVLIGFGLNLALLFQQQTTAVLLPRQQAAQQLNAEIQTLSALAAQMALTSSVAEVDTFAQRIEAQWGAVERTLVVLEHSGGVAEVMTALQVQMNTIRRILTNSMALVREHRVAGDTGPQAHLTERNLVRGLHAETVKLATHASALGTDLTRSIAEEERTTRLLIVILGSLILLAGAALVLGMRWQYRFLERRLIGRIENLSTALAGGAVHHYLASAPAGTNDEIDLMHDELHQLLDRVEDQQTALELLATTDVLTGLNNRRIVLEALDDELARARRHHMVLALIMLDIDHFKQINDTRGHGAGDLVLAQIGGLISASVRQTDRAGRYGGEEFLLVLPCTELSGALELAEKLRRRIAAEAVTIGLNGSVNVTVSLGVAIAHEAEDADAFLARVDAALYAAKRGGRNRVEVAS
jgi:diguanylate cyclase (GGDEF)-like protein